MVQLITRGFLLNQTDIAFWALWASAATEMANGATDDEQIRVLRCSVSCDIYSEYLVNQISVPYNMYSYVYTAHVLYILYIYIYTCM